VKQELLELLGLPSETMLSRVEISKGIHAYVKNHKLQNPENGQLIRPDEKLAKLFGNSEEFSYLKLHSRITPLMIKPTPVVPQA
jgi:chromatin remodeling complex protein RSC6